MCRVEVVTTDPDQTTLVPAAEEARQLERLVGIHLDRLRVWTTLPDERTDWALEALLEDLAHAAMALRRLRGEADLPF